jgi:hypothetical protein
MANIKDKSSPTITSKERMIVESTTPSAGSITNVSGPYNAPVFMNLPEMAERGQRADALVEMAGEDGHEGPPGNRSSLLGNEIRKTKMKG